MKIYIGDITKLNVDVIVNTADTDFSPGGGVARWIAKEGGDTIFVEARKTYRTGKVGNIYPTNAGSLKAQKVYHIPTIDWARDIRITLPEVHSVIVAAIEQLRSDGLRTIAFPLLGAGTLKLPADSVAEETIDAILHMEGEFEDVEGTLCVLNEKTFDEVRAFIPEGVTMQTV